MRVSMICALFALLLVSINAAPQRTDKMFSWSKQMTAAQDDSACLNSCSNHGQCITSTSSKTVSCLCDAPYLGNDCSVQSTMKPVYFLNNSVGVFWAFNNSNIVVRMAGYIEPSVKSFIDPFILLLIVYRLIHVYSHLTLHIHISHFFLPCCYVCLTM